MYRILPPCALAHIIVLIASTLCFGNQNLNIYWGDLHGHCNVSDGSGTPSDYYTYGRYVSELNFLALTDHSCNISSAEWTQVQQAAAAHDVPGTFVPLIGYEWSDETKGHRVVLLPTLSSGPAYGDPYYRQYLGQWPDIQCPEENFVTYEEFWAKVRAQAGIVEAAHPTLGSNFDWNYHDGEAQLLAEIVRGLPAGLNDETKMSCEYPADGRGVQNALARGYRLGFTGVSDTHKGYPGAGAKTAVLAAELTREAILDAIAKRHVYAVSGTKINLEFTINDYIMGEEFRTNDPLSISLSASSNYAISKLEILKNNQVVWQKTLSAKSGSLTAADLPSDETAWYYARVTLTNGDSAWASPIWVATPEPSSIVMLAMGLPGPLVWLWKKGMKRTF